MNTDFQARFESPNKSELSNNEKLTFFALAVFGFSFWFFIAVPFASHRETLHWLAIVKTEPFSHSLTFISSTFRPLFQAATWLLYLILDPHIFPTSLVRQFMLQFGVYSLFLAGWWLIYSGSIQKRTFALLACLTGGIFFSPYIHLFHVYGIAYGPVIIMMGALIYLSTQDRFKKYETYIFCFSVIFVIWHPFVTALFVGYYFGYCIENLRKFSKIQFFRAFWLLACGVFSVLFIIVIIPRLHPEASALLVQTATRPSEARILGLIVSYKTNEVHYIASVWASLLSLAVIFSIEISLRKKIFLSIALTIVIIVFWILQKPILLIWVGAAIAKLIYLRCWRLIFLALTAAVLPLGGSIGAPMYAFFAIVMATYATALGWRGAEKALSDIPIKYYLLCILAASILAITIRIGITIPVVTNLSRPLLAERERTFQLESMLWWLHKSKFCRYEINFSQPAGSPIESVEGAIKRQNRPPAALEDVELFWRRVLQCRNGQPAGKVGTVIMTFGEPVIPHAIEVFETPGQYAGTAKIWIADK